MKRYSIGLITGVLFTASAFMFIGARSNHTHDATEIEYKSFQYGGYGTLQKKIKEIDSKVDDDHTHDATEIEYNSFQYGGYGSLQKKIKDLEGD